MAMLTAPYPAETAVLGKAKAPAAGRPHLPMWPLYAAFIGYPVWWRLGVGPVVWVLVALPMVANMLLRGNIRAPRGFGLWALFLFWTVASAVNVHGAGDWAGWLYRFAVLLAGTIILLYIYNARETLTVERVAVPLVVFWIYVVLGGYLGVLFPSGGFTTPMAHLIPGSFSKNPLVAEMIHPRFAEYNPNAVHPYLRTSAPFTYTNNWGSNFALLIPWVFVALSTLRRGALRTVVLVLVPLSLIPAFLTLNRGMFLSLGIGLLYVTIRFAARGQHRAIVGVIGFVLIAGLLTIALPVQKLIADRVTNSHTNDKRLSLYVESWQRTLESPVLGYGGPIPPRDAPSGVTASTNGRIFVVPPVGTQGQVWLVMVSTGLPGLAFFLGFFLWAFWRTRHYTNDAGLWLHTVILIALVQFGFYGITPEALAVLMAAVALAFREQLPSDDGSAARRKLPRSLLRPASVTSAVPEQTLRPAALVGGTSAGLPTTSG